MKNACGQSFFYKFPGHLRDYTTASIGKTKKKLKINLLALRFLNFHIVFHQSANEPPQLHPNVNKIVFTY
jgi:hypothetical protein